MTTEAATVEETDETMFPAWYRFGSKSNGWLTAIFDNCIYYDSRYGNGWAFITWKVTARSLICGGHINLWWSLRVASIGRMQTWKCQPNMKFASLLSSGQNEFDVYFSRSRSVMSAFELESKHIIDNYSRSIKHFTWAIRDNRLPFKTIQSHDFSFSFYRFVRGAKIFWRKHENRNNCHQPNGMAFITIGNNHELIVNLNYLK